MRAVGRLCEREQRRVSEVRAGGFEIIKDQLDPCHYNFLKLDFMLKFMSLSGMIFNVTPNFTELWWHESNFPMKKMVSTSLCS